MPIPVLATEPILPPAPKQVRASGTLLRAVHMGWLLVLAATIALFIAGIPGLYSDAQHVCMGTGCLWRQLSPEAARAMMSAGFSVRFYAIVYVALEIVQVVSFCGVATLMFFRKRDDRIVLLAALMLVTAGGALFAPGTDAVVKSSPPLWWLASGLAVLGAVCLLVFFYLFPDGRFVPRWTRGASVAWGILATMSTFSPAGWVLNQNGEIFPVVAIGFLASAVTGQIYRYRYLSDPQQRVQTKWVVYGFGTAAAGLSGVIVIELAASSHAYGQTTTFRLADLIAFHLFLMVIPISTGIAVLRSRLFDIELIINRTLVYGTLSTLIIGVYVVVVGAAGMLARSDGSLVLSVVVTGLVAVLFQPLRARLQRGVNRLMYGDRDEPYTVIASLGQRLEQVLTLDAVLPAIVELIARSLKLPYTAILLQAEDGLTTVASYGASSEEPLVLPLVYGTETIGKLMLGPRSRGEAWTSADHRVLADLARQAGVAVHAARVTRELHRSNAQLRATRAALVIAREEERRRLRRDLHDGLGPALASFTLKVGAIRKLLIHDQAAADAVLMELGTDIESTFGEIRHLVYNLRPPALDELGLIGAIQEYAFRYDARQRLNQPRGLHLVMDVPAKLPPLPAAIEVAAYRIVQEAATNVSRHALACTCTIRLWVTRDGSTMALNLDIADDGVGIPAGQPVGAGMLSMRERALELAGTCTVGPASGCGTRVRVCLPFEKE